MLGKNYMAVQLGRFDHQAGNWQQSGVINSPAFVPALDTVIIEGTATPVEVGRIRGPFSSRGTECYFSSSPSSCSTEVLGSAGVLGMALVFTPQGLRKFWNSIATANKITVAIMGGVLLCWNFADRIRYALNLKSSDELWKDFVHADSEEARLKAIEGLGDKGDRTAIEFLLRIIQSKWNSNTVIFEKTEAALDQVLEDQEVWEGLEEAKDDWEKSGVLAKAAYFPTVKNAKKMLQLWDEMGETGDKPARIVPDPNGIFNRDGVERNMAELMNRNPIGIVDTLLRESDVGYTKRIFESCQGRHWPRDPEAAFGEWIFRWKQEWAYAEARLDEAQGKLEAAEQKYRVILSADSKDFDHTPVLLSRTQLHLGMVCLRQKKAADAIGHFKKAIDSDPYLGNAYRELVLAYIREERKGEAEVLIRQGAQLSLGEAFDRDLHLGIFYLLQGDFDKAIENFDKVVKRDFEDKRALYNRALAYWTRGMGNRNPDDFREAERNLELLMRVLVIQDRTERRTPDHQDFLAAAAHLRALTFQEANPGSVGAEVFFKLAEESDLTDPWISRNFGRFYFKRGQMDSALKKYDDALKRDPKFHQAVYDRALTLSKIGREAEAVPFFKQLVDSEEVSASIKGDSFNELSNYYLERDVNLAFQYATSALQNKPNHVYAHLSLAQCYQKKGQSQEALTYASRALELCPRFCLTPQADIRQIRDYIDRQLKQGGNQ